MNDNKPQELFALRYMTANGKDIGEMQQNLLADPAGQKLLNQGDLVLIWVSEGDLINLDMNIWVYNQNVKMGTLFDPNDGI